MNILLIPRVVAINKSLVEYSIDGNWQKFINFAFTKSKIFLPYDNLPSDKIDLIILGGGNDLSSILNNKSNRERDKITRKYFNLACKKNIPLIGVCYGAQFIASNFKCVIKPVKKHIKIHKINLRDHLTKNLRKSYSVNSFHNYGITSTSKNIKKLAIAEDETIELFMHNKIKLLGLMWHPERYKKFKVFDKILFNMFIKNQI